MGDRICLCEEGDRESIYSVINEAATAYEGVIPPDRYEQPYMEMGELSEEMDKMTFYGHRGASPEEGLVGVMAIQPLDRVTLIRHAYVIPPYQRKGVGSRLLNKLEELAETDRLLVGTWKAACWAIRFYREHGFRRIDNPRRCLKKYWNVPERQIETSTVLEKRLSED